ncbi:sulfatase-like hydrolase/transferase [Paenibacillus qinlingensis]|uniref:Arylsulfatase A-like enzyme n=1 Tax=Paenibacillus qinlingensis TaxID=1837343 RepID=A0ABU1NTM9_9BACL|nr:sulfatase-like hydrolase/transferase [Paenibacillus qinlingensis]MDR6550845.1 arylsulfatase A-like enzyme [Paenibacillus qinlingensis]
MNRPNILVIMTDQQHAETIGPNGLCKTPNIDRLMKEGVTFTSAFTPCPMCTPARASTMTGTNPHQHKLVQNAHSLMRIKDSLAVEDVTIGSAMQQAGYETVYGGKWHVGSGSPLEHGFDNALPIEESYSKGNYTNEAVIEEWNGNKKTIAATAIYPAEDSYVFRLAKEIGHWLDGYDGSSEKPFFLFASCHEPHVPWIVPEPYASMYSSMELEPWPSYNDDYSDKPMTYSKHYNDINFCRIQNDWPRMKGLLQHYFGAVTLVDDAVGRIVDDLEQRGLLDNTIILFTTDHGEMMGRHGMIGKNEIMLEDLIRIPMVAYWKNHFQAGECRELVTLCDLFNTVLDLAGAEKNTELDSVSFAPALYGRDFPSRKEVVIEHHGATIHWNTVRAIRDQRYKYVFRAHEIDELYDLEVDPHELLNRISDPQYREIALDLRKRLVAWAVEHQDFAVEGLKRAFQHPHPVEFAREAKL